MAEHAHRDRVLDLVYGEIEGAEARALRRELEACPSCAPELQKMEDAKRLADALPLAPLPSTTRASILAAARLKANETAAALPAREREVVTREAVARPVDLWERVRRFLLGPQTAMAAVMLLVVAIGVWYLPGSPESPLGASTMRPEPDLPVEPEPEPVAVAEVEANDAMETAAVDPAPAPPRRPTRCVVGGARRARVRRARRRDRSRRAWRTPATPGHAPGSPATTPDGWVGRGVRAAEAERQMEGAQAQYAAQEPAPPLAPLGEASSRNRRKRRATSRSPARRSLRTRASWPRRRSTETPEAARRTETAWARCACTTTSSRDTRRIRICRAR
ncbi:MAG: hypothetical protein R3B99_34570 [Polyangiales bacterium]